MENQKSEARSQEPAPERTLVRLTAAASKTNQREYAVQFCKAGFVRNRSGGYANWTIPADTLRAAVPKLDSVAVFIDHPEDGFWAQGYPSMRNLAAVTCDPTWDDALQAAVGKIRLYSAADWLGGLLDELLADQAAGKEVPDVGLSLVFYGKKERKSDGTVVQMSIDHVESCDIVFGPAAEGRVRAALSRAGVDIGDAPPQSPPAAGG